MAAKVISEKGKLYLIPCTLGDCAPEQVLPAYNLQIIQPLRHFAVEDVRSARRFLRSIDRHFDIDHSLFVELNEHSRPEDCQTCLRLLLAGHDVGVISEAGCPAVADPGADLVALAQQHDCMVVPLVGPNAFLLALMGSGFNGQQFAFHGYLPIEAAPRIEAIKKMEHRVWQESQTQFCMETPYRNQKLAEEFLQHCKPETHLCIAMELSLPTAYLHTHSIAYWRKHGLPDMNKRPCLFGLYK